MKVLQRHGSSPPINRTYGENWRSVAITVLDLWHFLHSNWPFYGKINLIKKYLKGAPPFSNHTEPEYTYKWAQYSAFLMTRPAHDFIYSHGTG